MNDEMQARPAGAPRARPPSNAGFAFAFLGFPAVLVVLAAAQAWPAVLLWLVAWAAWLGRTADR